MSEQPEEQVDQSSPRDEVAEAAESSVEQGDALPEAGSGSNAVGEAEVVESASVDEAPGSEVTPAPVESAASSTVEDAPAADEAVAEDAPPPPPKPKRGKDDPLEEIPPEELEEEESLDRDWYILKVQSNREKSIRDALERRMKVAGLDRFFGDIIVPTEDIAEYKNGKRKITKRKLWPGYIVVNMAINDDTWFLVRETPGIGDFTGSIGKPSPMLPHEVERILPKAVVEDDEPQQVKIGIRFKAGDRVRVKDGYFQNFEGDVESVDEANGRVTVICSIFGRSTPVELEHWQIEEL